MKRCHRQLSWSVVLLLHVLALRSAAEPRLSDERCVFQTKYGDVEFGFFPEVAPITAAHIFKLCVLGGYTGNHIFRVDKGFVAQVADVAGGRNLPMNKEQKTEADRTVPLEVVEDVKHLEGVVSMGRYDDPNSGGSSFSFLLGAAPHLDMHYTIFGRVTAGLQTLHDLEALPTRKEGIFVMPLERITIHSTYWYSVAAPLTLGALSHAAATGGGASPGASPAMTAADHSTAGDGATCEEQLDHLRARFNWQAEELQRVRHKCLPGF